METANHGVVREERQLLLGPMEERKPLVIDPVVPVGPFTVFIMEDGSNLPRIDDYNEAKEKADRFSAARIYDHGIVGVIYTSPLKNR